MRASRSPAKSTQRRGSPTMSENRAYRGSSAAITPAGLISDLPIQLLLPMQLFFWSLAANTVTQKQAV